MSVSDNIDINWDELSFSGSRSRSDDRVSSEEHRKLVRSSQRVERKKDRLGSDNNWKNYKLPPIHLLNQYSADEVFTNRDRVRRLGEELEDTCRAFKVDAEIESVNINSLAT